MTYHRQLSAMLLIVSACFAPALAAYATPTHSHAALITFVRADNVWIAAADGTGAREITRDGTGTRIINGRQVTYAYLTWSPVTQRLLVARFESNNPTGGAYRQGWSLETWSPGDAKLVTMVKGINSQDFIPNGQAMAGTSRTLRTVRTTIKRLRFRTRSKRLIYRDESRHWCGSGPARVPRQ
jgi:hypothetical protein